MEKGWFGMLLIPLLVGCTYTPMDEAEKAATAMDMEYAGRENNCGPTPSPALRARMRSTLVQIDRRGLKDKAQRTPVQFAIMADDAAQLQRFLAMGYPLHVDQEMSTPLELAASYGATEVLAALLAKGEDPNGTIVYRDNGGHVGTPLSRAIYSGNVRQVRMLFAAGGKIDLTTDEGETAVRMLGLCATPEIGRMLVDAGVPQTRVDAELARAKRRR